MTKYSLIVLARNEEKFIEGCLKSLKEQTYSDFEIIVVDNDSIDKTSSIARKFTKKVILEKKRGYMNAALTGSNNAKGKFISFCDADCRYPKNWLLNYDKILKKHPHLVALYGPCEFFDHSRFVNMISKPIDTLALWLPILMGNWLTPSLNCIVNKEAYNKVGGYDPKIYNYVGFDLELGKRLQKIGKLKYVPSNHMLCSSRRFKESGTIRTFFMYLFAGLRVVIEKKQNMTYEEYNQIKQ